MNAPFQLTDPERNFLLHWHYEAAGPFWGPALIWCVNHGVNAAYGPYPLAELFWDEERQAGRIFWNGARPVVPFRVPWQDAQHFWDRVDMALSRIPRLQDDQRFRRSALSRQAEGTLTPEESNYLRAYNAEMVRSESGYHIDLALQHGVLGHHLIPFFALLDDLYRPPVRPVAYAWQAFPARYEVLSGRKYVNRDYALSPR